MSKWWVRAKVRPEGAQGVYFLRMFEVDRDHEPTTHGVITELRARGYETHNIVSVTPTPSEPEPVKAPHAVGPYPEGSSQ